MQDENAIERARVVADSSGFTIQRIQGLVEGNHWYTKNSLALFIIPDAEEGKQLLLASNLVEAYVGEDCAEELSLWLRDNGRYLFTGAGVSNLREGTQSGQWRYRQYPYLELKSATNEQVNYYFEISQFTTKDKISDVSVLQLSPVNKGYFSDTCKFVAGLRLL